MIPSKKPSKKSQIHQHGSKDDNKTEKNIALFDKKGKVKIKV